MLDLINEWHACGEYVKSVEPDLFPEHENDNELIQVSRNHVLAFARGVWIAAKKDAIPQGCAVVPVKATDWQRVKVRDFDPDICDYELMGKHDWEALCARIYEKMVEAYDHERP